jgi:hypothetical protein
VSETTRRPADPVVAWTIVVAAVLRVLSVVGLRSYRYVDSIDYETLDFTGGSRRPWVTPLLYHLVGDDPTRVFAQALLGAVCWSLLAAEVALHVTHTWARRLAVLAIALLGASTAVTNWDTTILSESLAISTTALAAAAFLRFGRVRTLAAALAAVAATFLWVFTRQNHLVLLGLVVATVVVVLLVARRRTSRWDRPLAALAGGLVVVAALASFSYGQNTEIREFNLAMVIGQRVITDPERLAWFQDHGMPLPPAAVPGQLIFPEPLLDDDEFRTWVQEDGNRTYARFLLTHPWYALTEPLDDLVADKESWLDEPRGDDVMLATDDPYGSTRQLVPEQLERLLFDPGNSGTIVVALVAVLAATAHRWRRVGWDPRWLVPLLMVGLQWPALTVVCHASTAALGRLALVSALLLRIGLIVQAALLASAWLSDPISEGAGPSAPPEPAAPSSP